MKYEKMRAGARTAAPRIPILYFLYFYFLIFPHFRSHTA
jgi:hypothetical protein